MNNIFNNLMLTVLTVGLFTLVNILIKQVKEYTNKNIKNERAKKAIEKALEVVTLAVNTTNEEFENTDLFLNNAIESKVWEIKNK